MCWGKSADSTSQARARTLPEAIAPFMAEIMQAPPRIPGYELMACLGGGPMTLVYSARDCVRNRPCAVKVLRGDWEDQPTAIKLLHREARAGLQVFHPHLVRLQH